jgi:hypothetical protein
MKIRLSRWKTAGEEKLMFILKRKKDSPESEIKPGKVQKEKRANKEFDAPLRERTWAETSGRVKILSREETVKANEVIEKEPPVRVLISASALEADEPAQEYDGQETVNGEDPVPGDVVDSLFVKVKRSQPPDSSIAPTISNILQSVDKTPQTIQPENKVVEKVPSLGTKQGDGAQQESLLANIFSKVIEEEETPLDRLIMALPDITVREVLKEAEEVQELMAEWSQNMGK